MPLSIPVASASLRAKIAVIPTLGALQRPAAIGEAKLHARRLFDALLAEAMLPQRKAAVRKRIALFPQYLGGFGDLIFGVKAARLLRAEFPFCTLEVVTNDLERLERVADGLAGCYSVDAFNARPDVDFAIQAPVTDAPLNMAQRPKFLLEATKKPVYYIAEYDFTARILGQIGNDDDAYFRYISSGFAPTEIGFLVDPVLLEFGASKYTASYKRCAKLAALQTAKLKEAIFGGTTVPAEALAPNLYFGYMQEAEPSRNFLKLITRIEAVGTRNVVVYLGGAGAAAAALDRAWVNARAWALEPEEEFPFSTFERWNFTNVNQAPTKDAARSFSCGNGSRKLKIICSTVAIPNSDIHTLLKASESVVFITGNQSLSEALAAGKIIGYEILDNPAVLRDLATLARSYNLVTAAKMLLSLASNDNSVGKNADLLAGLPADLEQKLKRLGTQLANTGATVRDDFAKLAKQLAEKNDLRAGLVGVVARAVFMNNELRTIERNLFAKITAHDTTGIGVAFEDYRQATTRIRI